MADRGSMMLCKNFLLLLFFLVYVPLHANRLVDQMNAQIIAHLILLLIYVNELVYHDIR